TAQNRVNKRSDSHRSSGPPESFSSGLRPPTFVIPEYLREGLSISASGILGVYFCPLSRGRTAHAQHAWFAFSKPQEVSCRNGWRARGRGGRHVGLSCDAALPGQGDARRSSQGPGLEAKV